MESSNNLFIANKSELSISRKKNALGVGHNIGLFEGVNSVELV